MTKPKSVPIGITIDTSTKKGLFRWQIEIIKLSLEQKTTKYVPIKRMFRFNPDNSPAKNT